MTGNRIWARPIVLWAGAAVFVGGIFLLTAYSGYLARTRGQAEDTIEVLWSMLRSLPVWGALWAGFVALFLVRYRGGARLTPWFGKGWAAAVLAALAFAGSIGSLWMITQVPFRDVAHAPFIAYWLAFAAYFQCLRAAAVARSLTKPDIESVFE